MSKESDNKSLSKPSSRSEISAFLNKAATLPVVKPGKERGRLIFAMDATASRGPTWDQACQIQGEMFQATQSLGGLDIQLCYYRGCNEFSATPWLADANTLMQRIGSVSCLGGHTQIEKVLNHAVTERKNGRINAVIFIGDCFEENPDRVCQVAGSLGILGVPVFLFHEGRDTTAESIFRQIAHLSKGAYSRFDKGSAKQLKELLRAVAIFAAGGHKALTDFSNRSGGAIAKQLVHQLEKR